MFVLKGVIDMSSVIPYRVPRGRLVVESWSHDGKGNVVFSGTYDNGTSGEVRSPEGELNNLMFDSNCLRDGFKGKLQDLFESGGSVSDCSFYGVNLDNCGVSDIDMVNNRFVDCDMNGFCFMDGSITNCSFDGCNLNSSNMMNAKFSNCEFLGSSMENAYDNNALFESCQVEGGFGLGSLDSQHKNGVIDMATDVSSESHGKLVVKSWQYDGEGNVYFRGDYEDGTPGRVSSPEGELKNLIFDAAALDGTCKGAMMRELLTGRKSISDCSFVGVDASWSGSSDMDMNNTQFVACNMEGFNFENGSFKDCSFENCKLNYSSIENASFSNCNFAHSSMNVRSMVGASFESCDFSEDMHKSSSVREILRRQDSKSDENKVVQSDVVTNVKSDDAKEIQSNEVEDAQSHDSDKTEVEFPSLSDLKDMARRLKMTQFEDSRIKIEDVQADGIDVPSENKKDYSFIGDTFADVNDISSDLNLANKGDFGK